MKMVKKLSLFAVLLLTMTLVLGGTLCYGAEAQGPENTAAEESQNTERSVNTQSGSKYIAAGTDDGVAYGFYIYYEWDEGYTGWFIGAELKQFVVLKGSETVIMNSFTHNADRKSSYMTVTIDYTYGGAPRLLSVTFYVDEYGEVYY